MTKDLTQGSPAKLIFEFAVPLLAGMVFQQLYNLVDTVIVGRVPDSYTDIEKIDDETLGDIVDFKAG